MKALKIFVILFLYVQIIHAGNLKISNEALGSANTALKYRMITFNISWENSWRTSSAPHNWDAAWVFIKYKAGNGDWQHASLSTVSNEHQYPSGSKIDAQSDGKGVFIYRSENGKGTFTASGVSFRWNYGADNVADNAQISIKVLGIEMVYIPQGSFFAGDNSGSGASFRKGSNDDRAWDITSEKEISVTNAVSDGYYYKSSRDFIPHEWNVGEDASGSTFTIPSEFPKGFRAIYCMKYELTQQQYADFLNLLTPVQAENRYDSDNYNKWGYTILFSESRYSTAHPDRACGYFSPQDGLAYADWCGLRPMSELEFEKICRGSGNPPVEGEFAWGTTKSVNIITVNNFQTDLINVKNSQANSHYEEAGYNNGMPLQVGIFEREGASRELRGATYYGVMEMSGNLNENCISVSNKYGRAFTYLNGNGGLSPEGYTDESNWPGLDGKGSGYRGGCFAQEEHIMQVSDRFEASVEIDYLHRHIPWGFRCVRTCIDVDSSYSISAEAGEGGTISPNGIVYAGSASNRTFSISPNPGYCISSVIVDGVSQGEISTFTFGNITSDHNISVNFEKLTEIPEEDLSPKYYVLHQNYPNPFNPFTKIKFELIKSENVQLTVFDLTGQKVRTLLNETRSAGSHFAFWDGTTDFGYKAGSGIYVYTLKAENFMQSKKMVFIK
ncbi:T9SS type A sorting domain-containing protein [candidate division KSB1 bacterium]